MKTLNEQLWDVVLNVYAEMSCNTTHASQEIGMSVRTMRDCLRLYRQGRKRRINPRIGSFLWLREKDIIIEALCLCNGNRCATGRLLGVNDRLIRLKIAAYKKHGFWEGFYDTK